jgi:ubiquinone/menaquinone biosynthesis C-methylase UbiE
MLRCPRCHGEIGDGIPHCRRCGARYARHGSILDFLDQGTVDEPSGMPVEQFAHRVVDDPTGFLAALDRGGEENDSLRAMARCIDLDQVLHDIKQIRFGSELEPSPFLEFAIEHARIDAESTVLDVGASCGRHLWELTGRLCERPPSGLVALDINRIVLTIGALAWEARRSASPVWIRGDALRLPFQDATFTHVLSNVTMILLPLRAALVEFRRVLSPGGCLTFTVEGPGAWWNYWEGAPPWSRRRFNLLRARLGNALLKRGFDWQDQPVLRRLSIHSQFDVPTVERFVTRAGLTVETRHVIKVYKSQPVVIAMVVRKP